MKTKEAEIPRPTLATLKRGHRVTPEEHDRYRRALSNTFGRPFPSRMGRPPKGADKTVPISLRVPPAVLAWAKKLGKHSNIGYQTIINNVLLNHMRRSGAH